MSINIMPKSTLKVLKLVVDSGPITPTSIERNLKISRRTVRYGLKRLRDNGLVERIPNLKDTRSFLYRVPNNMNLKSQITTLLRLV